MKALKIFESLDFERGKDPIDVMDIGIKSWVRNWDSNYFKLKSEERKEATEKWNLIMSKINFEEIPFDTEYLPLEAIFGFKYGTDEKKYRQFKLDYDLFLSIKNNGYYKNPNSWTGYLTDEKGRIISKNDSSSAGKEGIDIICQRTGLSKNKFSKSRK
jgi:hypothetical protein